MVSPRIVLSGACPRLAGLTWECDQLLRIGRQANLDVVLHDFSVERVQAEVRNQGVRWTLRDLANNPLYPTIVNDEPLPIGGQQVLHPEDTIQFGKLQLKVTELREGSPPPAEESKTKGMRLDLTSAEFCIEASSQSTWDQALARVALQPVPDGRQGQAMLTLLRTQHHLTHLGNLEDLLQSILADAIKALAAQRGAIILADPVTGELTPKAVLDSTAPRPGRLGYSRTLIKRCFGQGESLLCRDARRDEDLKQARSVRHGEMASIVCALLRTPRRRLGVLHLDRGPFQEPYGENELYLADAIAASVAIGIESAQLIEQQREQFLQTVTTLARTVEMRDQYTGDHTRRVTEYSLVLADELRLPPVERHAIEVGTPLHDIGKIAIDDAILRKPGKLSPSEFECMKSHTVKGAAMLDGMFSLVPMIPIVRHHHERWDGQGYPDRLAGEDISLKARIVSVADAFDAMTSNRPYRPARPAEEAFVELLRMAGTHFDPACVAAFLRSRRKIEELLKKP